jgi:hypothetical protein
MVLALGNKETLRFSSIHDKFKVIDSEQNLQKIKWYESDYGGSAGSFNVIASILKGLNKVKIPIVIILHRLKVQKQYLKYLQLQSHYTVKEAEDKEFVKQGIYISFHLTIISY